MPTRKTPRHHPPGTPPWEPLGFSPHPQPKNFRCGGRWLSRGAGCGTALRARAIPRCEPPDPQAGMSCWGSPHCRGEEDEGSTAPPWTGVSPAPFPHQMIPTPPSRRLQRGSARPAVAPGPGDRDRGGSGAVPALCQAPAPRSDRRSPSRESKGPLRPSGHPSVRLSVSPGQEQRPRPRPCRQELGERPPHTTGTLGTWSSPRLGKRTPERGPDPAAHRGLWLGLPPGTACALLRTHGC